jgi:hypothetical protein
MKSFDKLIDEYKKQAILFDQICYKRISILSIQELRKIDKLNQKIYKRIIRYMNQNKHKKKVRKKIRIRQSFDINLFIIALIIIEFYFVLFYIIQ